MKKKLIEFFLILIIFNLLFFYFFKNSIIQVLNSQNIYNVNNGKYCIEKLNPKSEKELVKDANICIKKERNNGETGDMFILRNYDKKIVWDASQDCKLPGNKSYLVKGKICSLFYSPKSCEIASHKITSEKNGFSSWKFNSNPEFDYFDAIKIGKTTYKIVSGGQYSELLDKFRSVYILFFILDFIVLILIFLNF